MGMTQSRRGLGSQYDEAEAESTALDPLEQGGEPSSSGVFRAARAEPRVSGGWTIAEQFVREGYCYRLLKRPVTASKDSPRLTKRELATLELASAGHSNKSIAQRLDVSPSTVGVLLFRAAAKLNVASRSDLLLAYQSLKAAAELEEAAVASGEPPDGVTEPGEELETSAPSKK
jgi:DNA-binding CsgD family transcriptional regulator